jgi:endo-1,3(4)-beta-glucanase
MVGLTVALLAGCASVPGVVASGGASTHPVLSDAEVATSVAGIVQRSPKALVAPRLAPGLTAPTNRWYSGLVFGEQPQPVFAMPLSFALTPTGFAFGLPQVKASADTIFASHNPAVTVAVGAATSVVTSDDASVLVVENRDAAGGVVGRTTIAQGWPFVAWTAERDATVKLLPGFAAAGSGVFVATLNGSRYAFKATGATVSPTSVAVAKGGSVVFWAVPEGQEPGALATLAGVPESSQLSYQVGADQVTTTLTYPGADVIARLPSQTSAATCRGGEYRSLYGVMSLCAGGSISWQTPRTRAVSGLDLSGVSSAEAESLVAQLRLDAASLGDLPADTYYGGKALQRLAMLLMVADQLKQSDLAAKLAGSLDAQLTRWTQPDGCASRATSCFVYDPAGKGLIGLAAGFGSDEYNDHHFHYGYFLYAAAVLAQHDPSVVARLAPVMNLLAADIASDGSSYFPDRRNFDPYAGHSWASGTAPFADGNNQESVSEAVNAYAGLSLWAQASGNAALATEADWMLSAEAAASSTEWLAPDLSGPEFAGYGHHIVTLNWGGKRDYATWFSAEPAAKLGILLLPMSPTSTYLAGDPARIRANVAEAVPQGYGKPLSDYVLMYSALAGPADRDRAVAEAKNLPAASIDDGLSRTYLLAWLYALRF